MKSQTLFVADLSQFKSDRASIWLKSEISRIWGKSGPNGLGYGSKVNLRQIRSEWSSIWVKSEILRIWGKLGPKGLVYGSKVKFRGFEAN